MVATATRTILENLDRIPNEDERTKVAVIAFDVSIYFFSMPVRFFATDRPFSKLTSEKGWLHRIHDARRV